MKTIREWLEELPEPYRSEALENSSNAAPLDVCYGSQRIALNHAFDWDETPQGSDYWYTLYKTI